MKKKIGAVAVAVLVGSFLSINGFAQENEKQAQTGFQFLSVVSDARAAAMAEAMTSLQTGSSALFFNPAGMTGMENVIDVSASINLWIADIRHNTFSVAVKPFGGDYGVIGLSAQFVDYGDFYGTRVNRAAPQGYEDTGIFSLNAMALGIGYAKQLTDQFSVGGQVRWVRQDLGESVVPVISATDTTEHTVTSKLVPLVFDFGTQFRPGIASLVFGMSVRNFSKEMKYVDEGFQAPLVFNLGISMNVLDVIGELPVDQSLYLSIDASHYRDHPEQIKFGLEYRLMNVLSLRGGYVTDNDESGLSLGAGVSQYGFGFDYAYTPFGVFDKVHRVTARFSL
jgi:hypothetical protein